MQTDVTLLVILTMALAAFLIGLSKGGLPGMGPLVTVLVALVVPSSVAIGVLLPLLMVGDVVALVALRQHVQRLVAFPVVGGSVVGVAGASFLLSSMSAEALEIGIVVIVFTFTAYRIWILTGRGADLRTGSLLASQPAGVVAGCVAGVTSTVAHAGGPPVAIHLLARELRPLQFAGTSAAIFWAVNWLKVPGYAAAGLFEMRLLLSLAPTAIFLAPGVLVGRWAAGRLEPRSFELFVLAGLIVGAILLLVL